MSDAFSTGEPGLKGANPGRSPGFDVAEPEDSVALGRRERGPVRIGDSGVAKELKTGLWLIVAM